MKRIITLAAAGALALAPLAPAGAAATAHHPRVITENGRRYTLGRPFRHGGMRYAWVTNPATGRPLLKLARRQPDNEPLCTIDAARTCMRDANNSDRENNPVVGGNWVSGGGPALNITAFDMLATFQGHELYTLAFQSHGRWDIGANDACSGLETRASFGTNTAWALTAQFRWINRGCTNGNNGNDLDAATDEVNGDQFTTAHYPGTSLTTVLINQ